VSEDTRVLVRARLDQALAYVRSAEPRVSLSRRAMVTDILIAVLALAGSLALVRSGAHSGLVVTPGPGPGHVLIHPAESLGQLWKHSAAAVLLASVPLAFRRRFPLMAFAVLLAGALATRQYATDITFLAIVFAGYSAVAYSRFRNAAMLSMPLAGLLVAVAFWTAAPATTSTATPVSARPLGLPLPPQPGAGSLTVEPAAPWRLAGIVVAAALVLIAVIGNAMRARDRMRRLQAEHEAATRRALEQERARIAGELHDVVTHNVSVMIVQAGAARQVLTESPDEAKAALLAVESSGRAAMTELRHLLGLLSPAPAPTDEAPAEGDLWPQPGLGQLQPLIDRVAAAGLPVELHVGGVPRGLPPGQDLAAFRVVQEALTNVIKHAGKPRTTITLDYRADDLVVEVADAGRPFPAAGPAVTAAPGAGRGLLGLRERMTLYGGDLVAEPRPVGGWLVRARMPVDPLTRETPAPEGPAPEAATGVAAPAAGHR
jgi:signal transduction histidine kinase